MSNSTGECRSVFLTESMGVTLLGIVFGLLIAAPAMTMAQSAFLGPPQQQKSNLKGFSGIRVSPNSTRTVYAHDQTIAVVEIDSGRILLNCELIEVYLPSERKIVLANLTRIGRHHEISFHNMMDLMERCHRLTAVRKPRAPDVQPRPLADSIFSVVLPGTKWCGAGDLAVNYFDLGDDEIDKCCRSHDLCPAKVRSNDSRYNLTNTSFYTKSHCMCDNHFYKCLKAQGNPSANTVGNIYFNILRVPCIQEGKRGRSFRLPESNF